MTSSQRRKVQLRAPRSPDRRSLDSSSFENDHTSVSPASQIQSTTALGTSHVNDAQREGFSSDIQVECNPIAAVPNAVVLCPPDRVLADGSQQLNQPINETLKELHSSSCINDRLAVSDGDPAPVRDWEVHTHGQQAPAIRCLSFLSRILRTYPRMMSRREQLPPFVHESQISSRDITVPLANCFALSRMWESSTRDVVSRVLVESSIRREMEKHFNEVSPETRPPAVLKLRRLNNF